MQGSGSSSGTGSSSAASSSRDGAVTVASAVRIEARPATTTSAESLSRGGLFSSLVVAYLRMLPGGAAWLQAALGAQLGAIIETSDTGLRLLTDPMDAYISLPTEVKEEVDRDVERGQAESVQDHLKVVETLSQRSVELCKRCEAVLQAVLAAAPNAPRALRSLAHALTGGTRSLLGEGSTAEESESEEDDSDE